eukprot:CAMPEP_0201584410 /NCGR_PEP_ID=MMETSP0190_2-20130828/110321_1 /ASSEMBLY_ACC=CAM_ASM_000263 /TAXON_ID=37353 /ORGANISM="Rosalina sp." /LENGTH=253 /DNA_ID=CAMNT_0048028313 /DNA_START=1 /DNA_END=762 /DNA_ORIENTATION=+
MASEYRRKSQRFESKINAKLSEYEKLSIQLNKLMSDSPTFSSTNGSSSRTKGSETEIQRVISESDSVLREIQQELQSLNNLKKSINTELDKADKANNNNQSSSSSTNITSLTYILQTCETQHRDLRNQYQKIENRIRANIKRHKVLKGANPRRRNANERTQMDAQLEENASLLESMKTVDHVIDLVGHTHEEMEKQGLMNTTINKGLGILQSKMPTANELMGKIKKYRNRDSIVLACVCAIALTLMFIYWLNK